MLTLEKRAGICVKKVKIQKQAYVSDVELKCRNLCDGYDLNCQDFFPVSKTQIPINHGVFYIQYSGKQKTQT
jgi:hypothetical protein